MSGDIYKKLAKHLDRLPGGYPATKSGVELRILRRLFDPEEAALAMKLSLIPEEVDIIARRVACVTAHLRIGMGHQGVVFVDRVQPREAHRGTFDTAGESHELVRLDIADHDLAFGLQIALI